MRHTSLQSGNLVTFLVINKHTHLPQELVFAPCYYWHCRWILSLFHISSSFIKYFIIRNTHTH